MRDLSQVVVPDQATLDTLLSKAKLQFFAAKRKGVGFLGSLLCDHTYIWDDSPNCPTAWCDGKTICFNPRFFVSLAQEQRVTLLVHELWHTGYDHMDRIGNRDPETWNEAADYVINNLMDTWGYNFTGMDPLLDHQYDNMTTEQVYEILIKQPRNPNRATDPSPLGNDVRPSPSRADQQAIKEKIVKAAQASKMAKEAGIIPGETKQLIEEFLNPILPWEILLERFYTELSKDDYSWKRPSRRYEDEYLPSLDGDNKLDHLIYYIDVSGSITNAQMLRFLSEVKHIHTNHTPKKITVVGFDTQVQFVHEFEEGDPFEKIEIKGRGGTNLKPVYTHIRKHMPTAAVVFSDLECRPMSKDPGAPILWVIMDNPSPDGLAPFGQRIHIKA
jgi:predicted metal-dependent peptidase